MKFFVNEGMLAGGALVPAGCRADIQSERPYVSIQADLLSGLPAGK